MNIFNYTSQQFTERNPLHFFFDLLISFSLQRIPTCKIAACQSQFANMSVISSNSLRFCPNTFIALVKVLPFLPHPLILFHSFFQMTFPLFTCAFHLVEPEHPIDV